MDVVPWLQLGGLGIVALVLVLLARQISGGGWYPRTLIEDLRAQYDARLVEKDDQIVREHAAAAEWRAAYETSERRNEIQNEQLRDLADATRSTVHAWDSIRFAAENASLARRVIDGSAAQGLPRRGEGGEDLGS